MKANKKEYKRLTNEFIVSELMAFYEDKDEKLTFRNFCNDRGLNSKRVSLMRIGKEINLFKHREEGATPSFVLSKVVNHLFKKKEAADEQIKQVHENNKVLTEDEVALVVSTCKELSTMGLGIDEDTCLRFVNGIIQERVDKKDFLEVTRIVVSRILKTNDELLCLMKGNSIDPKRFRQADVDVRNALFVKLENFIKLLYNQGKIPWKSVSEIPLHCMSNMDKIATNAHDHRKKVIADKLRLGRLFQEVNSGDNKMPFHITVCITSTPSGKFKLTTQILYFISQANK